MTHETTTVDELIAFLTRFPSDASVYVSHDNDGTRTFSALCNLPTLTEYNSKDKVVALSPLKEGLQYNDIFPVTGREDLR